MSPLPKVKDMNVIIHPCLFGRMSFGKRETCVICASAKAVVIAGLFSSPVYAAQGEISANVVSMVVLNDNLKVSGVDNPPPVEDVDVPDIGMVKMVSFRSTK